MGCKKQNTLLTVWLSLKKVEIASFQVFFNDLLLLKGGSNWTSYVVNTFLDCSLSMKYVNNVFWLLSDSLLVFDSKNLVWNISDQPLFLYWWSPRCIVPWMVLIIIKMFIVQLCIDIWSLYLNLYGLAKNYHLLRAWSQLSNLWWMPNSVRIGFGLPWKRAHQDDPNDTTQPKCEFQVDLPLHLGLSWFILIQSEGKLDWNSLRLWGIF